MIRPNRTIPALAAAVSLLLLIATAAAQQSDGNGQQGSQTQKPPGTWFPIDQINPSLPDLDDPGVLNTPQACVEFFDNAAEDEDWQRAAHALNFRLVGDLTPAEAAATARKLDYLLNQRLWIDWSLLPDRPDGLDTGSMFGGNSAMAGQPRRSIDLGGIALNGRSVPIRIQRVKTEDGEPVWLVAAQSVANIDQLYERHGPGWLAERVPQWSKQRIIGNVPTWQWLALLGVIALAVLMGYLIGWIVRALLARHLPGQFARLARLVNWPLAIFIALLGVYIAIKSFITLPGPVATVAGPVLLIGLVAVATWLTVRILTFIIDQFTQRISANRTDETIDEGGTLVQLTIARYVVIIVVILVGISIVLINLDMFRTLGIALISSAGAAAVIVGIAGHAVIGNLIAGLQIALTNPFRIGDSVYVEDNWGRIEELSYTFVAVRTWDKRRLVFPIKYFINNWFENWSRTDAFLTKPIYLKVDYRADVEAIRDKFLEFVREDEQWAGEEKDDPMCLVTECDDETITVRLTAGGATPKDAWFMHCRVREKMIAWLQQAEDGDYLPRRRIWLQNQRESNSTASDAPDDVEHQAASASGTR